MSLIKSIRNLDADAVGRKYFLYTATNLIYPAIKYSDLNSTCTTPVISSEDTSPVCIQRRTSTEKQNKNV